MFTRRLNAVGGFDFVLKQHAPVEFRRFDRWSWVVFTASRLTETTISRTNLLGSAVFSGILRTRQFEGTGASYSGPGLLSLLGDEQGKGPATTTLTESAAGDWDDIFTTGAGNVFGTATRVNGLTILAATDSVTLSEDMSLTDGVVLRTAIEEQLALQTLTANMDYYVSAAGRVAWGYPTNSQLFTQTPVVMVWTGPTTTIPAVPGVDEPLALNGRMTYRDDDDDFCTGGTVTRSGGVSRATRAHGLKGFDGTSVLYMEATESDTSLTSSKGSARARKVRDEHNTRYAVTCTVEANPAIIKPNLIGSRAFLEPGDYIYLYDPDIHLSDVTNNFTVGGQVTHPKKFRAVGVTFPIIEGMGVYVCENDWGSVVDVSEFVEWESGEAELEIGESVLPRTMKSLFGGGGGN